MLLITKILAAAALIVITIEFITVFRVRRDRRDNETWENINQKEGE